MNKDFSNENKSNEEEVDLIKLLNYFKNGVKSFFRKLWSIVETFFQFLILLKKNWIIVIGLTVCGLIYGWYISNYSGTENADYEMIVRSNPVSNLELYAFSNEVNNANFVQNSGVKMMRDLGISNMSLEPLEREEDVISNYFDQIESVTFRGDQTDTLYYQASEINSHKGKMKNEDYMLQKIKLSVKKSASPEKVQTTLINYLNSLPGPKNEKENKLAVLKTYENILIQTSNNIDSILSSRATMNKNSGPGGSEQMLVNTASRGNVEADLIRYSEVVSRKIYGTQKKIAEYQNGISVISNLRLNKDQGIINNSLVKYGLYGFLLASILILLLQFNKYLNRISTSQ